MNTKRLLRVQAASGLVFLLFASLHLLNTALAALGPDAYNGFQRALRPVYQHPVVEVSLILAPLGVHIAAGLLRMRGRPRRQPAGLRQRVHRYAGYFLMLAMAGHVYATRQPALQHGAWPEFEGVAFTFQFLPAWFYPYYAALALAGVLHAALGVPLALGVLGARVPAVLRRGRGLWIPAGVLAALVVLGVAGLGGLLYPIADQSSHPYAVLLQETRGGR